jgi:colicin import membrane protein
MRFASWARGLPVLLACAAAWAQAPGTETETVAIGQERARIATERARADQRFAADEIACQKRFAVTDCVEKARTAQRAVHNELRRQELVLNDTERRRRTDAQQRRLQDKQNERAADAASRTNRAPPSPGAAPVPSKQLPRDAKPVPSHAQQAAEHEAMMRKKLADHAADEARRAELAANAGEEERRYAERQREAAQHKARILQRKAEQASTAKPLPTPP